MPRSSASIVVAVSGNIASGKSSLAALLVEHWKPAFVHIERPERNTFVGGVAKGDASYRFASQVWFLLDSINALRSANDADGLALVERLPAENALFARAMLAPPEYELYRRLYDELTQSLPPPHGIICLRADLPTLTRRSQQRNNPLHDSDYLHTLTRGLVDAYEDLWKHFAPSISQVTLECSRYDFVASGADRTAVLMQLSEWLSDLFNRSRNA
jgi:deoxyadenosine/deoxycytidine kinase